MTRWIVAVTLAASLALNLWLLRRPSRLAEPAPSREPTLKDELSRCRAESFRMAVVAAQRAMSPPERPVAVRAESPPVSPQQARREWLCRAGEEHLREHWTAERAAFVENLRRSARDEDELRRGAESDADEIARQLELSAEERRDFTARYANVRRARVLEAAAALDRDPPEVAALVPIARALFVDEDALVAERFGEQRRQRLRAAQTARRTGVLAIAAALAAEPFDEALDW